MNSTIGVSLFSQVMVRTIDVRIDPCRVLRPERIVPAKILFYEMEEPQYL